MRVAPVTVVRIIDRLNVGGPAIHAVLLAARLDPQRFHTVLVHGDIEPGEGDMSYLLTQYGVSAVHIPGLSREIRPLRDARAFLSLLSLMLRLRPEVVHTHKSKAGLLGRAAAACALVPVRVHTYHGHVLRGYFGGGKERAIRVIERLLGRMSTRIVTVSESLAHELTHVHRIAAPGRIEALPLGLDLMPFRAAEVFRGRLRHELGLHGHVKLIGYVGRMVPIKDPMTLVAALSRVMRARADVHAVLVGGGELEDAIRGEIARLGLSRRVHLVGWRRDLPAVYADLDLLVLSSKNEGTPVTLIEAMAAGVPVVATAVGGVPDVLAGGQRGKMVPPGDAAALALGMLAVLSDAEAARRARGDAQRDEVVWEYGIDRLCHALGALYEEEVLRARRRGREKISRRDALAASAPSGYKRKDGLQVMEQG